MDSMETAIHIQEFGREKSLILFSLKLIANSLMHFAVLNKRVKNYNHKKSTRNI